MMRFIKWYDHVRPTTLARHSILMLYHGIHWIHVVSIDVAIGAALNCWMVSYLWDIETSWLANLLTGLAALCIYSIDHLLDLSRGSQPVPSKYGRRRTRHSLNKNYIMIAAYMSGLIGCVTLWSLPFETIKYGMILALLSALYLWSAQYFKWLIKEPLIALGYTAGIHLYAWTATPLNQPVDFQHTGLYLVGVTLLLIAGINLLLCARFDAFDDYKEGRNSVQTRFGSFYIRITGKVLLCTVAVLNIALYVSAHLLHRRDLMATSIGITLCLCAYSVLFLLTDRDKFSLTNDIRPLIELILYFPALALLTDVFLF